MLEGAGAVEGAGAGLVGAAVGAGVEGAAVDPLVAGEGEELVAGGGRSNGLAPPAAPGSVGKVEAGEDPPAPPPVPPGEVEPGVVPVGATCPDSLGNPPSSQADKPWFESTTKSMLMTNHTIAVMIVILVKTSPALVPNALEPPAPPNAPARPPPFPR